MALQIADADWKLLDADAAQVDRLVFYGVTVSSFLEISIEHYTASLRKIFAGEPEVVQWLDAVWEPEERAHGQAMRAYMQRVWPQYGWGKAYAGFIRQYAPLCSAEFMRPTPALEMLARCVTECEAAVLYRTLANFAHDPLAKQLFTQMYEDEVAHYKYFFRWFRILREREQLGAFTVFGETLARQRKAQNEDVGIALTHVNAGFANLSRPMPFVQLEESTLSGMAKVAIEDHFPFETARAMMLKPLRACSGWGKPLASAMDVFYRLGQRAVV
jgi:hypothetical protein